MNSFFAVGARMASRWEDPYRVAVVVNIAPMALPYSKPSFFIDDSFGKAEVEQFLIEHERIHAASNAIIKQLFAEWRMPTEDEIQRMDALVLEHHVAVAMLERTRETTN